MWATFLEYGTGTFGPAGRGKLPAMADVRFWGEDEIDDEARRERYKELRAFLQNKKMDRWFEKEQPVAPPEREGVFVFVSANRAEEMLRKLDEKNIAHRRLYKDGRFHVEIDPREFDRLWE